MFASQLGRILLAGPSDSPDQHTASPDEGGSYGELMDLIDTFLERTQESQERLG